MNSRFLVVVNIKKVRKYTFTLVRCFSTVIFNPIEMSPSHVVLLYDDDLLPSEVSDVLSHLHAYDVFFCVKKLRDIRQLDETIKVQIETKARLFIVFTRNAKLVKQLKKRSFLPVILVPLGDEYDFTDCDCLVTVNKPRQFQSVAVQALEYLACFETCYRETWRKLKEGTEYPTALYDRTTYQKQKRIFLNAWNESRGAEMNTWLISLRQSLEDAGYGCSIFCQNVLPFSSQSDYEINCSQRHQLTLYETEMKDVLRFSPVPHIMENTVFFNKLGLATLLVDMLNDTVVVQRDGRRIKTVYGDLYLDNGKYILNVFLIPRYVFVSP